VSDTIDIRCAKCGAAMRVHAPSVAMAHDWRMSQVSLIPGWSIDERKCRTCGSYNAPMIVNIQTEWVGFDAPAEERRVQPASLADMKGLKIV
jgi:hypothetical protein